MGYSFTILVVVWLSILSTLTIAQISPIRITNNALAFGVPNRLYFDVNTNLDITHPVVIRVESNLKVEPNIEYYPCYTEDNDTLIAKMITQREDNTIFTITFSHIPDIYHDGEIYSFQFYCHDVKIADQNRDTTLIDSFLFDPTAISDWNLGGVYPSKDYNISYYTQGGGAQSTSDAFPQVIPPIFVGGVESSKYISNYGYYHHKYSITASHTGRFLMTLPFSISVSTSQLLFGQFSTDFVIPLTSTTMEPMDPLNTGNRMVYGGKRTVGGVARMITRDPRSLYESVSYNNDYILFQPPMTDDELLCVQGVIEVEIYTSNEPFEMIIPSEFPIMENCYSYLAPTESRHDLPLHRRSVIGSDTTALHVFYPTQLTYTMPFIQSSISPSPSSSSPSSAAAALPHVTPQSIHKPQQQSNDELTQRYREEFHNLLISSPPKIFVSYSASYATLPKSMIQFDIDLSQTINYLVNVTKSTKYRFISPSSWSFLLTCNVGIIDYMSESSSPVYIPISLIDIASYNDNHDTNPHPHHNTFAIQSNEETKQIRYTIHPFQSQSTTFTFEYLAPPITERSDFHFPYRLGDVVDFIDFKCQITGGTDQSFFSLPEHPDTSSLRPNTHVSLLYMGGLSQPPNALNSAMDIISNYYDLSPIPIHRKQMIPNDFGFIHSQYLAFNPYPWDLSITVHYHPVSELVVAFSYRLTAFIPPLDKDDKLLIQFRLDHLFPVEYSFNAADYVICGPAIQEVNRLRTEYPELSDMVSPHTTHVMIMNVGGVEKLTYDEMNCKIGADVRIPLNRNMPSSAFDNTVCD